MYSIIARVYVAQCMTSMWEVECPSVQNLLGYTLKGLWTETKLVLCHLYCLLGEVPKLCLHVNLDSLKQVQEVA